MVAWAKADAAAVTVTKSQVWTACTMVWEAVVTAWLLAVAEDAAVAETAAVAAAVTVVAVV
jgi:hypothetical protein